MPQNTIHGVACRLHKDGRLRYNMRMRLDVMKSRGRKLITYATRVSAVFFLPGSTTVANERQNSIMKERFLIV